MTPICTCSANQTNIENLSCFLFQCSLCIQPSWDFLPHPKRQMELQMENSLVIRI